MTGTEWQVQKDERKLIPHKIFTYKFVQGSDQTLLTDRSASYIAVDKEHYYYQDKAVSIAFTDKVLEKIQPYNGGTLSGYDGIPLGAMIPYFGVKPPKGYRWCNGNDPKDYPNKDNVYPHADWVPKHLVGMPLPDMREHLLGGARKVEDIGVVFDKGAVTVPSSTIQGSNFWFTTQNFETGRIQGDGYVLKWETAKFGNPNPSPPLPNVPRKPPDPVGLGRTEAFQSQAPFPTIGWVGLYQPAPATIVSPKFDSRLAGNQTIPAQTLPLKGVETNPRHYMCRWIIRVE
jgi:hypothetical protein